MKKYSRLFMALIAGCCLMQAGQVFAGSQTYMFPDDTTVFPNYTGSNTADTIVGPWLNSMTVTWDDTDGRLLEIVINSSSSYYQWDSLFINTDAGSNAKANWDNAQQWDYLVHTSGTVTTGTLEDSSLIPGPGLYAVSDGYDYTHASGGRTGHVDGIADDGEHLTLLEDGFQGVATTVVPNAVYILTYDFSSLSTAIYLTDNFVIGYTPWCANDVMLAYGEDMNQTVGGGKNPTVPEPATMILFGVGIVGLGSWRSRRMKK